MVKTKLIYIIGSIIIGFLGVIGVFFGLAAAGVISTDQPKIVIATSSAEKVYDGTALVCEEWAIVDGELKEGHVANVVVTSSIKEVGESENLFTVTINDHVGANVTDDYKIEMNPGTLKVAPRPLTILTKSAEKIYDGTPLARTDWELTQDSSLVEGHILQVSMENELVDVGVLSNGAKVKVVTTDGKDVTKNYAVNRLFGTLEVKPLSIVIYTSEASKMYDGTPLVNDAWELSDKTPILKGHTLDVTTTGTITEVGEVENEATATITSSDTDVTNNYEITWHYGELSVLKCDLLVFTESAEKIYDGTALKHEKSRFEGALVQGHELKVTFENSITNAGKIENYAVVAVYDGEKDVTYDYDIETKFGMLEIKPFPITIHTDEASKIYDGEPLTKDTWYLSSATPLLTDHSLDVTPTAKLTEVGEVDNVATAIIKNGNDDVTENYDITWQYGKLIVLARPLTVFTESASKTYDGTVLENKESTTEGDLLDGHEVKITFTKSLTNAGKIANEAIVAVYHGTKDVSHNYDIKKEFGDLEVKPVAILISTEGASKIYDGTALEKNVWKLSEETPLLSGHALSVTVTGTRTEVGKTNNEARATITSLNGDVTSNYAITWNFGELNVLPCPLTVFTESASKTYDGTPLECHVSWVEGDLLDGHEVEILFESSLTDAGNITNYAVVNVYDGEKNVSYNYNITRRFGVLTINPRAITLRSASAEKDYDGQPLTCEEYETVSVLKVLDFHNLYVSVSGEQLSIGSSPNDFGQIYITAEDENGEEIDVTRNYTIKQQLGTLTIKAVAGGNAGGENPSGGLENNGQDNDDTVFLQLLSSKTTTLYLRDYSYGNYYGQGWEKGVTYSNLIDGKYAYNYLFSILLKKAQASLQSLEIKSSYTYVLPYYMEMAPANYQVQNNDVAYSGDISAPYSLYYYDYNFVQSGVNGLYGVNLGAYSQGAEQYEEFVKQNYLDVPASTLLYLNGLIAENSFKATDTNIIAKVAQYIQNAATYDLKYDKTLDTQSDIVVSFLRDYKTGVCRHYASAATLLYRALGIPARYVSGFLANVKADEWTEVTGKQYHAWVEVYVSGCGWVQVDVTGGSSSGGSGSGSGDNSDLTDPKVLTVTPMPVAVQYQGNNIAAATNQVKFNSNFKEGYTYEAVVSGELTEPGKGKSTIVSLKLYNESGTLIYEYGNGEELLNTENWDVKLKKGSLHLYLRKLTFTSASYSKIYDGQLLTSGGEYSWTGQLETDHVLEEVLFKEKIKEVGKVANTFTVKIVDQNGEDVTDCYLIEKKVGTLTVTHREIIVTAGSKIMSYDEDMGKITCDTYSVGSDQTMDALVAGETLFLKMTEESYLEGRGFVVNQIDVDSIVIKDQADCDVTKNYIIETQSGIIIVQ